MSTETSGDGQAAAASSTITTHCEPQFQALAEGFHQLFADGRSTGCSLAVMVQGETVFNGYGGYSDPEDTAAWKQDTLCCVFSASKAFTAVAVLQLAARGDIELDAPVGRYWPAFSCRGKEAITVAQVLGHRAGIPGFSQAVGDSAIYDWNEIIEAVEATTPLWPPDTQQGYHPFVFGWVLGELIRRVSGEPPADYIRRHICAPLGLEFHMGLDEAQQARCAHLRAAGARPAATGDTREKPANPALKEHPTPFELAFHNPPTLGGRSNSRDWRGAVIPAANGHTTACSLAKLYSALLPDTGDDRILPRSVRAQLANTQAKPVKDTIIGVDLAFESGFYVGRPGEMVRFSPRSQSFGHPGAGGSVGFADPGHNLSFGFCTRDLSGGVLTGGKAGRFIDTLYSCFG